MKYVVVAIDYYTKWVEEEPLAKITEKKVTNFVWENITCQFNIPNNIIFDHGTQFDSANFKEFCENFDILKTFSTPAHPQSNGQVEAVSKMIKKKTLKKKLSKLKGSWVDELSQVLWSYQTSFHATTEETPFSLFYGVDDVVPIELTISTFSD